jgi:glycosyltransferase involved in cell wall biosynthesis
MKIALAHDSFTQLGGAERVLDALHELFPDAPVFTLVFDPKFRAKYKNWDIHTSGLQTLYLGLGKLQYLLPLIPWGVDSLDFTGFDVVVSSSSGFVKNIRVPKNCIHINYCHTPTRFLWSEPDYVKQEVPWLIRPLVKLFLGHMKKWDYNGAQRVSKFIANSKEVQARIKKYYNRDSEIVYPFIDTSFWHPVPQATGLSSEKDYFLLAGRLQAHKQNDLIVEIFNELGLPLHVVGTGRQEEYLKSIAKPNIKFFGFLSNERLRDEYSGAKGFIFPQLEDFGLMPLEAAACGTATLALGQGGVLETIIPGVTGEFFGSDDVARPFMGLSESDQADKSARYKDQIKQLILSWNPKKYSADDLRHKAEKFSKEKFMQEIKNVFTKTNENRHRS